MRVEEPDAAPGPLGRDAYRIVREALANVSKHARGTAATVSLFGRPGEGLRVTVRNKLTVSGLPAMPLAVRPSRAESPAAEVPLPGAGLGLVSLAERVALAGGTLAHGPDDSGDFVRQPEPTQVHRHTVTAPQHSKGADGVIRRDPGGGEHRSRPIGENRTRGDGVDQDGIAGETAGEVLCHAE